MQHRRCPQHLQRGNHALEHPPCSVSGCFFVSREWRSDRASRSPPPKEQAKLERWSLVFFTRPSFDAPMRALTEQSSMIAEAVAKAPAGKFETGVTAGEWLARRILITRASRFKVSRRFCARC